MEIGDILFQNFFYNIIKIHYILLIYYLDKIMIPNKKDFKHQCNEKQLYEYNEKNIFFQN